jgi:quinolinate synthase
MCGLCPYMKQITLPKILRTLEERPKDQIIEIPENIRKKAEKALLKMFELTK